MTVDTSKQAGTDAEEAGSDRYAGLLRELRGPVASIQSYVRTLIARDAELTSPARATIHQVILQQSQKLDGFVDDVVLYVQLLTHAIEPRPEPVLLAALLEEVRHRAGEPERVEVGDGVDVVLDVDRSALGGALRRLVRNGLVYGPRSGSVRLTVGREEGWTTIEVCDSGPGIPAQVAEHAMQPFTRGVRPDERRVDGAGLGLAVTRELAALMGGELVLDGAGPGLTAALRLPSPR